MNNTYLTWKFHVPFFIIGLFMQLFLGIYFTGLVASIYLILAWLFRKEHMTKSYINSSEDLVIPFSGKINNILDTDNTFIPEKYTTIELKYNFFSGFGIFFPGEFEIYDVIKNDNEILINFQSKHLEHCFVHFKKNFFGLLPNLWVFSGDKGKRGANIGFFPMGGKMNVYIPNKYIVNYKKNQLLLGGKTLLGLLPTKE